MESIPVRSELNPAFTPAQDWYIYLPSIYADVSTNSFSPNDMIKSVNGKMKTAFDTGGDSQSFLDALKPQNHINLDTKVDLIGFGLRLKKNYFSFGVAEHANTYTNMPYELAWLLINGLPQTSETKDLDLKSLSMNASVYTEYGLGYSRQVLPNLTVGAKVKFLVGQAHAGISFSTLNLKGNYSSSVLTGNGLISVYTPFEIPANNDGYPNMDSVKFGPKFLTKSCGSGMAFDFGTVYKPIDNLTLSFSVTDLGAITWNKDNWTAEVESQTQFNDVSFKLSDGNNNGSVGDSLQSAFSIYQGNNKLSSKLTSHVRVGAEYAILNSKINFGLLYDYRNTAYYSDGILVGSVNFRPFHTVNASVAYSLLDGKTSSLSAGLDFNLGPVVLFLASDGIPMSFADGFIPKSNYINLHAGIVLAFGGNNKAKNVTSEKTVEQEQITTQEPESDKTEQEKPSENPKE